MPGRCQMPSKTIKQSSMPCRGWDSKLAHARCARPCVAPAGAGLHSPVQLPSTHHAHPSCTPPPFPPLPFSPSKCALRALQKVPILGPKKFQKKPPHPAVLGRTSNGVPDDPLLIWSWSTTHGHRPYSLGRTSFLAVGFGAGFGDRSTALSGTGAV